MAPGSAMFWPAVKMPAGVRLGNSGLTKPAQTPWADSVDLPSTRGRKLDASYLDAAPLAVELTEFGDQKAPAADMLTTLGAVGGPAGGFGGRANPAQMAATGGGSADSEAALK
jgi:hypothetical protein